MAAAISGWWYWRNLSGLNESVILFDQGLFATLLGGTHLNWITAIDSILFSHIYFGGWSSLTVRSWMYHLFYLLIAAATLGLLRARRIRLPWWPVAVYAAFWLGQCYNVLLSMPARGCRVPWAGISMQWSRPKSSSASPGYPKSIDGRRPWGSYASPFWICTRSTPSPSPITPE